MAVPKQQDRHRYAELLTYLPAGWAVAGHAHDDRRWWPAALLRRLGRFVHVHRTWFAPGHTARLADPGDVSPPGAPFGAVLLLPCWPEAPSFDPAVIGRIPCRFLWVFPITEAEASLARDRGADALVARLGEHGCEPLVDPTRACVASS